MTKTRSFALKNKRFKSFRYWFGIAIALIGLGPLPAMGQAGVGTQFELAFWQSVANSEDAAQFEAYLAQYPSGTFSALAKAKIAVLQRRPSPSTSAAPTNSAPPSATPPLAVAPPSPAPPKDPVVAPPPVAAKPAAVTPPPEAEKVAPGGAPISLSEQLRALANSQGNRGPDSRAGAGVNLPGRPQLAVVPKIDIPPQFCSAQIRNDFYDLQYRSVLEIADQNNRASIAFMTQLQQQFDVYVQRDEPVNANVFAAEAKAFEPIARQAYAERSAFDRGFSKIMAAPIVACVEEKK